MSYLPSCYLYFHATGDMFQLAKLHRLLSCLSKQNKQNQTTWSVMKSLLPGYELIMFSKSDMHCLGTSEDSLGLTNPSADFLLAMAPLGCFQDTVLTVLLFWKQANNGPSALSLEDQGWHFSPLPLLQEPGLQFITWNISDNFECILDNFLEAYS